MKSKNIFPLLLVLSITCGCSTVQEPFKVFWGSSTRGLENARVEALTKNFVGSYDEIFKAVIQIAAMQEWEVFQKDKTKGYIVVMGIKGNVNTTEVGVFFEEIEEHVLKVDISSESSPAKIKVAGIIFPELSRQFQEHI